MELHSPAAVPSVHGDRYVDVREAAAVLGLSVHYLNKLRTVGGGPAFSSLGRAIRYKLSNLHAWADAKSATSTSTREAA